MGGIQAPMKCPACENASPSRGHLYAHKKRGELVQVQRKIGKLSGLVWERPEQLKAKVL